jgi:hypothetical protein
LQKLNPSFHGISFVFDYFGSIRQNLAHKRGGIRRQRSRQRRTYIYYK